MTQIGLRARLLLTSTLVLGLGLGLTAWVLDRSFTASVVAGAQEQMKLLIYGLLGAAEDAEGTLAFPQAPLEPRLQQPQSGLYATVTDGAGAVIWRSPSLAFARRPADPHDAANDARLTPGTFRFRETDTRFEMSYRVIWETAGDRTFTFHLTALQRPYRAAIASFRRTLMLGLIGVAAALMAAQVFAVAWGLRPVAEMARRIQAVETGEQSRMGDAYPPELVGLARNIDRFIDHEVSSRDRYRRAMDDLAHSLKTPLAVLRNALAGTPSGSEPLLREQLDRMESAVTHQLSRALAARPVVLAGRAELASVVARLRNALRTAYAQKDVDIELRIAPDLMVRCDERDLMEMLGNLLENAFKYCARRVLVEASGGAMVRLTIDDDGPGVPSELRRDVLARGARADTAQPGQGIGLAVVAELAASYGGSVTLEAAPLGGARAVLDLPGAPT